MHTTYHCNAGYYVNVSAPHTPFSHVCVCTTITCVGLTHARTQTIRARERWKSIPIIYSLTHSHNAQRTPTNTLRVELATQICKDNQHVHSLGSRQTVCWRVLSFRSLTHIHAHSHSHTHSHIRLDTLLELRSSKRQGWKPIPGRWRCCVAQRILIEQTTTPSNSRDVGQQLFGGAAVPPQWTP